MKKIKNFKLIKENEEVKLTLFNTGALHQRVSRYAFTKDQAKELAAELVRQAEAK